MYLNINFYLMLLLTFSGFSKGTNIISDLNTTTTEENVYINNNNIYTWNSTNYPQNYYSANQSLLITVDNGYSVLLIVEHLDLDSDNGDFLIIKSGSTVNDTGKGKIFVYNLKQPRKYLIHTKNILIRFYVFGKNEAGKKGFFISYRRLGEDEILTTDNPTTEVTWPTPSASDSIYYTAYIINKTEVDYKTNETLNNLKTAISEMAIEYCASNNILLKENITIKNVHLYLLTQCPINWPNSKICIKVRFALPIVFQNNSVIFGYQLTTQHLEQMWKKFGKLYLEKYNFDIYNLPETEESITKWIAISFITLIVFLIFLFIVKVFGNAFFKKHNIKRRSSDTSGIINNEIRFSKTSLGPHPLQVTPPFFDNDYAFDQFEPEIGIPKRNSTSSFHKDYPLSEDDSDIEIIFNKFTIRPNDVADNKNESNT